MRHRLILILGPILGLTDCTAAQSENPTPPVAPKTSDEIHAVPMRNIGGDNEDDLVVMLTRRWDWANELLAKDRNAPRRPTAEAVSGCEIHLRDGVTPKKVFTVDLRSGRKTALKPKATADGTVVEIPPFRQVAAVVIDMNGDTR